MSLSRMGSFPDDDITILHVTSQRFDDILPRTANLDRKYSRNPWDEAKFRALLKDSHCHLAIAMRDEKILGFMVYEAHDRFFQLLKLETNPDAAALHVKERLFERMIEKLRPDEKTQLICEINEHDTSTLCMLRDRYGFKSDKKILSDFYENGDGAYIMRYRLLPLPERLRHMLNKLIDITGGMEWQVVERQKDNSFVPTSIKDTMRQRQQISDLAFRTSGKVKDPKAAFSAICRYFGTRPVDTFIDSLKHPHKITIPAFWVEQIHTTKGRLGELADAFQPSDFQSRLINEDDSDGPRPQMGR